MIISKNEIIEHLQFLRSRVEYRLIVNHFSGQDKRKEISDLNFYDDLIRKTKKKYKKGSK
jgi:hypothetical protein